jgi:hypothetical protein
MRRQDYLGAEGPGLLLQKFIARSPRRLFQVVADLCGPPLHIDPSDSGSVTKPLRQRSDPTRIRVTRLSSQAMVKVSNQEIQLEPPGFDELVER